MKIEWNISASSSCNCMQNSGNVFWPLTYYKNTLSLSDMELGFTSINLTTQCSELPLNDH